MLRLELCCDVALKGGLVPPSSIGTKALALLAVLVLEPRAHRRDELAALLWGEYPEEKAKASLRQALTHLRDAVGDGLRIDRATVELAPPPSCDVTDFLALADASPWRAADIDVPRFLDGLTLRNSPAFEEWAERHRATLLRHYREVLAGCAREALARRDWSDATRIARRWHEVEPLADEPVAALMQAQFLGGDRHGAHATFVEHMGRLSAEGHPGPGRELVELEARIHRDAARATPPRSHRATDSWYEQGPSFDASLIGREREWQTLRAAWEGASRGPSRVVLIEGEPGVGKSRLAEDFARWIASQGSVVLRGRGYDGHAGAPFGAVIEVLGSALDAPGLAGVAPEWLAEVARVVPELRSRFPGLRDVSAAGAADGWRLFEGIAQVLLAIAEDTPVAVLVDDLQWCDADSCSLLHYLTRRLQPERMIWIATFSVGACERDAPAARLSRALRVAPGASFITLHPLREEEVWRLVRELGRVDAPTGARRLAARIHEVTAGNPFYVIELLKTLFAQELITVDPASGGWLVTPPALAGSSAVTLSPTVHEAVAERIECLPDELHAMLISIAVSGRGCRAETLSHLHGISRLRAVQLADSLVERHLVTEGESVYRCAHPIIAHVVREGLSTSRRREVHRALALALEMVRTSPTGSEEDGEIARHAEQAGERPMAYRYALAASDGCVQRCAYDEALSWLDLAAGSAATAEESEVVNRTTARVLEQAGWGEAPPVRAPATPTLGGVAHGDLDLPVRQ